MSVLILTTSKLEANRESSIVACVLDTCGGGGKGVERGRGEVANHVTALISWLNRGGGRGNQTNLVLDFHFVLILCTTLPLV